MVEFNPTEDLKLVSFEWLKALKDKVDAEFNRRLAEDYVELK